MPSPIVELGNIGESLVFSSLRKRHESVVVSENKFDSEKDGTVDGLTVEVKTQVPIKIYKAFCIGSDQVVKCLNADRLFFVKIAKGNLIEIYESLKPRKPTSLFYNRDVCYFFKLTDLHLYDTIEDESIASRMRQLSPSKYL
jgi:hypothetical protein